MGVIYVGIELIGSKLAMVDLSVRLMLVALLVWNNLCARHAILMNVAGQYPKLHIRHHHLCLRHFTVAANHAQKTFGTRMQMGIRVGIELIGSKLAMAVLSARLMLVALL